MSQSASDAQSLRIATISARYEKMLQTNRTDNSVNPDTMPDEFRSPVEFLKDLANFVRRRFSIISFTFLVTLGVALLYLIAAEPKFTAQADLLLESKVAVDPASGSSIVESQMGIIKSDSIARAVIRKLDLEKDPEFVGHNGVVRVMTRSITRLLGWRGPETQSSTMQYALESFQRKLSVKRSGLTYIVGISFESVGSERAAWILNTIVATYIAQQMDAKYNSSLQEETWIKDRLNELSNQASAAQKALEDYRKEMADSAISADTGAARPPLTAQTQGKLRELVAAAESSTSAYDNFRHMLRQMEAGRHQSAQEFAAHLITEASPPLRASSPRAGIALGLASVGGLLLGIAIGMLRDLKERGFRTSGQDWKELQIPCIAVVPKVWSYDVWRKLAAVFPALAQKLAAVFSDLAEKQPMKLASAESPVVSMRNGLASVAMGLTDGELASKPAFSSPAATGRPRSRNIVRTESPIWTIIDSPRSRFAESFVEIKLAIDSMSRSGKRNQVIGITSTQQNEGKSTVAAALALLIANAGARVILVDCNLRNRSLSSALAPAGAFGISDVMTGAALVSETTWTDLISQLAFLPAGNNSRPISAGEVLASEKLDTLFKTLREGYEYVIVDLPAVAPFADVGAAAHLLDSFIFVVESGRTNISVVERALEVCSDTDAIMLGVALNKAR